MGIVRGTIVLGGNCPGVNCLGGICLEDNCPGGNCSVPTINIFSCRILIIFCNKILIITEISNQTLNKFVEASQCFIDKNCNHFHNILRLF